MASGYVSPAAEWRGNSDLSQCRAKRLAVHAVLLRMENNLVCFIPRVKDGKLDPASTSAREDRDGSKFRQYLRARQELASVWTMWETHGCNCLPKKQYLDPQTPGSLAWRRIQCEKGLMLYYQSTTFQFSDHCPETFEPHFYAGIHGMEH